MDAKEEVVPVTGNGPDKPETDPYCEHGIRKPVNAWLCGSCILGVTG